MTQVIFIDVLLAARPGGESEQPTVNAPPAATMAAMAWRRSICSVECFVGSISDTMPLVRRQHFVYDQTMSVGRHLDAAISRIASAIGEPARARMLYCLMDGHARTSTELAIV